ncbi:MAG: phosphatase PAP2 family protein [Anaerolineae bacterium]
MRAGLCSLGGRRAALIGAAMAALFLAIAAIIALGLSETVDQSALYALRRHALPWLTEVMLVATFLGSWPVVALGVVWFAWANRRHPQRGTYLLVAACVGAALLSLVLKLVFHRPRPTLVPQLVNVGGFSFPSGHALLSLAFYGTLGYVLACRARTWWQAWLVRLAATAMVALIGLSRVYLGVHYVTDVVAGYATAVAWVSLLVVSRAVVRWPGEPPPAAGN